LCWFILYCYINNTQCEKKHNFRFVASFELVFFSFRLSLLPFFIVFRFNLRFTFAIFVSFSVFLKWHCFVAACIIHSTAVKSVLTYAFGSLLIMIGWSELTWGWSCMKGCVRFEHHLYWRTKLLTSCRCWVVCYINPSAWGHLNPSHTVMWEGFFTGYLNYGINCREKNEEIISRNSLPHYKRASSFTNKREAAWLHLLHNLSRYRWMS